MFQSKTTFFCQNCGARYPKWQGQCQKCGKWNTIEEQILENPSKKIWDTSKSELTKSNISPILISEINIQSEKRIITKDSEFNRVMGGGIVPGSIVLLGGEPGIGKSTLFLQLSLTLDQKVLYVSGEESENQIKLRADRIKHSKNNCLIYPESKLENIFVQAEKIGPDIIIIDSIQTLTTNSIDSVQGSITQLRSCTAELINFAKKTSIPIFLIGHINKDGNIAGPKILEHMVDTVLQFEGDNKHIYRILRVKKNRFGSTNEIGIYEMFSGGLKEILNPSEILIGNKNEKLSGTAICASVEGSRPIMIEVQALVSTAIYGTPQRTTTGINSKRLNMLLAVLEKRVGFNVVSKDVFINITGGLKVEDTANDLAIVAATLSSSADKVIDESYCFAAEIGLSGEVRPVNRLEQRIKEAEKLGYSKIFISKHCDKIPTNKIKVIYLSNITDLMNMLTI
tara:strand:- start:1517 stop:2878 length:1362 start_codon:yes stop_codon:yes gene_type:complete